MALTDEQLKALGLYTAPPEVAPQPASPPPAAILSAGNPPHYPQSILGNRIAPGAMIPTGKEANQLPLTHEESKELYQGLMPKIAPAPTAAPGTLQWQQQRTNEIASRAAQMDFKKANPWGSAISEHPGIAGKILHGLSIAGNIAGNIVEPGIMSLIPGTQLHDAIVRSELGRQENEAGREARQTAASEAQTAHTQAETEEIPTQEEALKAQTEHAQAETEGLKNPEPKSTFEKTSDGSIVQLSTDPHTGNTSAKLVYKGNPNVETDMATLMVGGKPHSVLINKQTGESIKDLGETKSPQGGGNLIVTPEGTVQQARPGMTLAPGTQNLSGFAQLNRPTVQERNVGAQAQMASEGIPDTIKEIQGMKDKLGPVMGRWNDFMQGKIGMDDPEFAGLRADLLMTSSAVALAHARGRLPENLREEFDRAINSPKQTPDNLVATLQHMQTWLGRAATMGQQNANSKGNQGGTHSFTLNGQRYENVPDETYNKVKGLPGFSE